MKRSLHRLQHLLRLPALALLLLSVLSNPVLAAIGDLHQATLASEHLAPPDNCLTADVDTQDGDTTKDLLHALVHGAHACGHQVAVTSSSIIVEPGIPQARPPVHAAAPLNSLQAHFFNRPPIAD